MRKIILLSLLVAAVTALGSGCDRMLHEKGSGDAQRFEAEAMSPPAAMRARAGFAGAPAPEPESAPISDAAIEQKIIRSAELRIKVGDVENAADDAQKIVEGLGGMVTNTSIYEDNSGNKAMRMTLKVPSEKLDEALGALSKIGEVKEEDIRSRDVTEEYVDLDARLKNAKRLEARLIKLLDTPNAKLEDIVKIEKELGRVREQIESMEGRKRYYDSRISLSTVEIVFFEPQGFGRGIFEPISGLLQRSLSAFTSSIALLIVFVSAAVPWAILLIVMGWISLRALRLWLRHKRAMKAKKEQK